MRLQRQSGLSVMPVHGAAMAAWLHGRADVLNPGQVITFPLSHLQPAATGGRYSRSLPARGRRSP